MRPVLKPHVLSLAIASLFATTTSHAADASVGTAAGVTTVTTGTTVNTAPQIAADDGPVTTISVTATRLKDARVELSPKVGTTVYSIDKHMIESLGQGENTPFNEVLLHLPGVSQDAKGSGALHVRDDHGNVQYRLNGVQLPEGISGFGQSIDTRFIDQVDFITGALPAQYGIRSAGIVDIQTKEGRTKPGGRVGVLVGSRGYVEPSAEVFGSKGDFNYFFSASHLADNIGIENPTSASNALHDKTRQSKTFGDLSYFTDADTRLGLIFGTYNGHFQIPNNPGQTPVATLGALSDSVSRFSALPSSQLNENQSEVNRFVVLSMQKSIGDLNFQGSVFHQYSGLHYTPDPNGDLIFSGVASDVLRSSTSNGVQFDMGYKFNAAHTVRTGLAHTRQSTHSNNTVAVFPVDGNGVQSSTTPFQIVDNSAKIGSLSSFYLQDEWHVSTPLTVNYGVRFDHISAYTNEQQWSPRINAAYKLSSSTSLHAGYSRYFTTPPQELASQSSINKFGGTTNAAQVTTSSNVKSERTHYYDVGISHQIGKTLTLTADAYYKKISNLIDEGQFGQALILSPYNYEKGYAKGLELSAIYAEKNVGAFLNLSLQQAKGRNIVSGQSLFTPDKLAYIGNNYVYVDHDQKVTLSGGMSYKFDASKISADFLYGTGLRKTPDGGAPNSASVPSYTTINTAFTHDWKKTSVGDVQARVAVINLFDKSYLLRDGTGIGVGAPQYGARRTLYAGLSTSF